MATQTVQFFNNENRASGNKTVPHFLCEPPEITVSQVVFCFPRTLSKVFNYPRYFPTHAFAKGGAVLELTLSAIALLLTLGGKSYVNNGLCHVGTPTSKHTGVCVAFGLIEQYSHEPYVAVARFQVKYLGRSVDSLDPKLVERGAGALSRLDDALVDRAFLVGNRVSLADLSLVAYTRMAGDGGFDLARYPAVTAWIGRVEAALGITDPA